VSKHVNIDISRRLAVYITLALQAAFITRGIQWLDLGGGNDLISLNICGSWS